MDSTDMELECDGSCETLKIVRDEDTDAKRKTIYVDLDSYGRENVPNLSKIRKNVKQSMVWDHFERLKGDPNDPRAKCSANALLVGMANNMKTKFEKYWGNNEKNNLLLYVAIVLDP
ncbi:transposase [Cucumis melo var. makuwa]|uniref:Transposase n=1 Tax=Cucumis melo var. makuwa TaxID=1194695 RepID=A0A5D3DG27_CUCMM|nr:transposase [Cucumis melo var. makuwa]TYK22503.1 transposase [Cucumis melo var. makuwa]